jgi:mono/diheme cytochrome c family protein
MKRGMLSSSNRHNLRAACSVLLWTGAICFTASGFQPPTSAVAGGAKAASATPARDLVNTYCVSCHNQKLKTASLTLDNIDAEHVFNSAETWEKVIVKLRSRAMPPPGIRRPDNATYDAVADWLESEIDRAAAASLNPGRSPSLHRLNRTEYANAVRDLVAVEVDAQAMLPPDEQAFGFDNNAEALTMQPALLERYVTAAAKIARGAVGDATIPPTFERYGSIKGNANEQTYLRQVERLGEEFPLGSRGGIAVRHFFPADGEYVFKLRLQRTFGSTIRGLNVPNQFEIRVDGKRVAQFTLGGRPPAAPSQPMEGPKQAEGVRKDPLYDGDDALQARVPIKAGLRQVVATMVKSSNPAPEGVGPDYIPLMSRQSDVATAPASISSLLIGGPYGARVPEDSPSRRLIFVCQPANSADEIPCATKILTKLARRAYRRSPTNDDVQTLLSFYKRGRAAGSFDDGIRSALERVLVSPDFLFRMETDPPGAAPGKPYRISDVELASRLSFALWSSIPDDTLLDLAIRGRLKEPAVLEQQVKRMLADPRARESLVQNFFEEWLQTRNVWLLNPEGTKFPWFDDNLRIAFVRETELFLESQLREDRSVVDLLTSNETFLNEQLARHYGIPGVYGSHFRRVRLADENRFGLLGKASVLAVTSYTTRTSPTVRGKWLLENILAAPMPPPPPNVPALEASNKEGKALSVRQMLEMHRANPTCASCHARMDPLGFSLENFDAIGQWRTADAGVAIDASGVLLDGTKVAGPAELRQAFVARKQQFVKAVTEKLLTYTLGRGLEYTDAPAVRGIVRSAAADDYRWSSVILGIVKSAPFQMRMAASGGG